MLKDEIHRNLEVYLSAPFWYSLAFIHVTFNEDHNYTCSINQI
jgi:hypothetical protein